MKNRSLRVTRFALTSLSAAVIALAAGPVHALGLGRLTVQSSLGEALRAEIDITSLAPEEASSLEIRIASPETYRAAGVEYHPALTGARVAMSRRPDGSPFLRVTSERVVSEPFVDVILEMSWATGRLVREYTLLLDPPRSATAVAATPTAPAMTAPPAPAQPAPVAPPAPPAPAQPALSAATTPPAPAPSPAPSPSPTPAPSPAAAAPAPAPAAAPAPSAATAAAARNAAANRQTRSKAGEPGRATSTARAPAPATKPPAGDVRVRPGDTLTGIAQKVQPPGLSLDQMLVALFRSNPEAFSGENMNRLRAGAILKVPGESEAQGISQSEARSTVQAQSADFNAYRRRLAAATVTTPSAAPSRQAAGKIQVDDRKQAATPTPDKLKLSAGATKAAASAPEAKISKEAAAKDASSRVAELARNLEELNKVRDAASSGKASAPATAAAPAPAPSPAKPPVIASAPTLPVTAPPLPAKPPAPAAASAPATAVAAASPGKPAASAPGVLASAPTMPASAPATAVAAASSPTPPVAITPKPTPPVVAAASAAKPSLPLPPTEPEPGLIDKIMGSPYVLPFGAVLAAVLAGVGIYRVRARGRKTAGETSFMESRLQPDSFFGASGGQRVDTHDGSGGASTAGSGMNYSLSQLDAIGDVDPVAEADVYLAYGRDLQAEEILKEAMRTDPGRLAVRTKLLEVYAKRRDIRGFELLATQLFTLTRGEGTDWQKAQELGRGIDPENPLYQPGGRPDAAPDDESYIEPLGASTMPHSVMPSPSSFGTGHDLIEESEPVPPPPPPPAPAPAPIAAELSPDVDIDLSFDDLDADAPRHDPMQATMPLTPGMLAAQSAGANGRRDGRESVLPDDAVANDGLEFDLSDLSLDLDPSTSDVRTVENVRPSSDRLQSVRSSGFVDLELPDDPDSKYEDDGDPLERKLDLADEFRQIGDLEGARDLLNEVLAQADDGALRQKAQTMLDSLG